MTALAEPGLRLDKRQRAMLKEMGVQVWQPSPATPALATQSAVAPPEIADAIHSEASSASRKRAASTFDTPKQSFQAPETASEPQNTPSSASPSAWRIGTLQTLYTPSSPTNSVRWLVLVESPASALQNGFNPLEGDAGKLLDNMLRAAQLHTAGAVMLVPLVRSGGAGDAGDDLSAALANTFATAKADVILSMGRLAAQALLQSVEPLGKLRGQVHAVAGVKTIVKLIVTLDPAYLLRNPLDKAKAWDDLCLGLSLVKSS